MLTRRRMKYLIGFLVYITCVPIFAKRYIQFNEEPSDVLAIRNKPATIRCNVTAENNVVISWKKDGVKLNFLNETRRTILPDGSLYFKTIVRKKKFSPDTGVYRCMGETIVHGASYKILSRTARLTVMSMSKSFVEKPQNLTISQGETAWFKCKVKKSHPVAKITWSKEGKNTDLTLNFRFVVLPSGTLEILSVLPSDAGNYICKATNKELGREITAKAQLTITPASSAAKPSTFLVKPSDVTTLYNKNVILECIVAGYPKPQVDWFKDGKKITLTGQYIKYGASSLKISSVTAADSGKYDCVMGMERAGAILQVIVPPQMTVLPTDIESPEDVNVDFLCTVTGNPKPVVSWFKNGESVDELEHITVKKDGITIMQVLGFSDEGIYQCIATNDGGERIASAQLTILGIHTTTAMRSTTTTAISTTPKRPPQAPSAPRNVKAVATNTTAILVSWQPPAQPHGIIKEYTIIIVPVSKGVQSSMPKTQHTSLMISNLKPGVDYQFFVYASNEYKRGSLSAPARERTKTSLPLLGPPRDVRVTAVSSIALQISWRPPILNAQVIKNYSIKYRKADSNTPWQTKLSLKHDVVLLKLQPYTKYSVKVTAHTDQGPGQTSPEVLGTTKSARPKSPPENIQLVAMNDMLVARWQPPSQANGNITGYVLRLRNENTDVISNFTTTKNNKVFMKVEKSTTYALQIAAVTEAGVGEFSHWEKKDMPSKPLTEEKVPGKPTNLRARVLLGMVQVSWDAPIEDHIIVREYVVSYGKRTPDETFIRLRKNVTKFLVQNLQSDTIYIIRVRAANKKGQGEEALESITIPRLRQSSGIYNLRAVPIRKRTMRVSWVDPTALLRPNVGYHLRFEKDDEQVEFNVSGDTSLIIEDLQAGKRYTFEVKKNNKPNYSSVSNYTTEEAPSAPKDVTVSIAPEESSVKVQWNVPDKTNGQLKSYKICWKPESDYVNLTCKRVKSHVLNDQISNINASLKYFVKILAKNSAGEGKFSEPKYFFGDFVSLPVISTTTEDPLVADIYPSTEASTTTDMYFSTEDCTTSSEGTKEKVPESSEHSLTPDEETLWIIIAVIAAITLIAIVVISIVLCKKRSRGTPVLRRKPPADPYKAFPNGNCKKKPPNKDNYWIKQDSMELQSCMKTENSDSILSTIPRSANEMKPLDSPFLSRKDRINEEEVPKGPDKQPYRNCEDYQPLPRINIYKSPFVPAEVFPPPPPLESEEPATSSDYGSEELVSADVPVAPNGCVSVAPDYQVKHAASNEMTLQNLMRDLDAIMAKEDRV